eukprot:3806897-Ditylum_brightwellii.AAC.1
MKRVWAKIGYADKKKDMGSISSLQVPVTWPGVNVDTLNITNPDNPNKVEYWKTVETPKEIATYLKL